MKKLVLLVFMMCPVGAYSADTEPPSTQTEGPKFYEHYLSMQRMQENLAGRSLDEQARLQPQIRRAEQQACQQLNTERREGVLDEEYHRQGGYQFLAFAQDFERYCETLR